MCVTLFERANFSFLLWKTEILGVTLLKIVAIEVNPMFSFGAKLLNICLIACVLRICINYFLFYFQPTSPLNKMDERIHTRNNTTFDKGKTGTQLEPG